jgi:hypothetical protein
MAPLLELDGRAGGRSIHAFCKDPSHGLGRDRLVLGVGRESEGALGIVRPKRLRCGARERASALEEFARRPCVPSL